MIITLTGEQPMSWNTLYSGRFWRHRSDEAKRVHWLIRAELDPNIPPFSKPVDISFVVYRKDRRRFDPDNVCTKLYIDGLVPLVIDDDDFTHVNSVKTAVRVDRSDPRVVIEVTEYEKIQR